MPHDDEWRYPGYGLGIFFRVIFTIVIAMIIFGIIFGSFGMMPMFFSTNWIWQLVGVIFLLWLVSWIFFRPWHHGYWGEGHEIRILRRRYARGEISRVQFKRMMKDLQEHSRE